MLLYVDRVPSGEDAAVIGHAGPLGSMGTPIGKADTGKVPGGGAGFVYEVAYAKQISDWL